MEHETTESLRRASLFGVPFDLLTNRKAIAGIEQMMGQSGVDFVVAVNPEKILRVEHDTFMTGFMQSASMLLPDGAGLVWAARFVGHRGIERVTGIDTMLHICRIAAARGEGVFLLGGKPCVLLETAEALTLRFPDLVIAGMQHGYYDEAKSNAVVAAINASGASVVFVALGSPKQERWMHRNAERLEVKLCQGVGGSFDVLSGRVRRAPKLVQQLSLEWLFRLAIEPSRIRRQQALPKFAWRVFRLKVRKSSS